MLFTTGMSARPMTVPPGGEAYRFAELLIRLPAAWPLSQEDLNDPNHFWSVRWLRKLARHPHAHGTWLGGSSALIDNGEPPEPFAPNSPFTSLLLLTEDSEFGRLSLSDGRSVVLYSVYPLFTEERALERRHGVRRLLEAFQRHCVPRVADPARPNAGLLEAQAGA
jgi:hypothetical protein